MGNPKCGPATSLEERGIKRMHVIYTRKMRERQIFMDDLKVIRKQNEKRLMKQLIKSIGPQWYQTLSVPQRSALDNLEFCIYQDILEGRPVRTYNVMKELGLYPRPNVTELMNCVFAGQDDPKEMLAHLFLTTYGHTIDGKRYSYCLNAKLMLSGILYLGLANLIALLKERFRPDPPKDVKKHKPKPKIEPPLASPYLQDMIAVMYLPPRKKPFRPAPLPANLAETLETLIASGGYDDEEFTVAKPPPPPPLPPPPPKKMPKSYCDQLAGVMRIEPHVSPTHLPMKVVQRTSHKRIRGSKACLVEVKSYGVGAKPKKSFRRKKPVAPSTGMWNAQYMIIGVFTIQGKTAYVLGNVTILPTAGELIHGGHRALDGQLINIHCGIRGKSPPQASNPCDCVKKWTDTVFHYIRKTKCYCGHHYDYGNEGSFLPDELPFFQKPTKNAPYLFNYHTIYDLDSKSLHVDKEFKRVWDTDSMLAVDDGTQREKKKEKKKKRRASTTCLGDSPKPEDYLKCVLRLLKRQNIAARLPDIHLVPELKEWMRRRIYGPLSKAAKGDLMRKSHAIWQQFRTLGLKSYGHVPVPKIQMFEGHTNWIQKQELNDKFRKFVQQYKLQMYRSHAKLSNMLWPSMFQAQFPDKKFREIYFSYLFARMEDLQLIHPFASKEADERAFQMASKRYCCFIGGELTQE